MEEGGREGRREILELQVILRQQYITMFSILFLSFSPKALLRQTEKKQITPET